MLECMLVNVGVYVSKCFECMLVNVGVYVSNGLESRRGFV